MCQLGSWLQEWVDKDRMFKRQRGDSGCWSSVLSCDGTWGKPFSHYLYLGSAWWYLEFISTMVIQSIMDELIFIILIITTSNIYLQQADIKGPVSLWASRHNYSSQNFLNPMTLIRSSQTSENDILHSGGNEFWCPKYLGLSFPGYCNLKKNSLINKK